MSKTPKTPKNVSAADVQERTRVEATLARQEVCTCGHTRATHASTFAGCYATHCKCERFTWDSTHSENVRLLATAKLANVRLRGED